jgi:hypothetical protein
LTVRRDHAKINLPVVIETNKGEIYEQYSND